LSAKLVSDHFIVRLKVCAQSLRDAGPLHPPAIPADLTTGFNAGPEAGHGARRPLVLDEVHTMTPPEATWHALLGRWGDWAGRRRDGSTGQAPA
jgi:hypothetical protein